MGNAENYSPTFMRGWDGKRWEEFWGCLKDIGARVENWVEAVPYLGQPITMRFALYVKRGLFSRRHLAAGLDEESLASMRDYIHHHPHCKTLRLRVSTCGLVVRSGDYVILERRALRGGDRQAVADIVRHFGGTQEDVSYHLDKSEDSVLGYVPSNAYLSAADLVEVVQVGRNMPCSAEEMQRLRNAVIAMADKWPGVGQCGDADN